MVSHMMQHMGTPNPGEAEADAGNPDAGAAAPTPTSVAPSIPGSTAADPTQAAGAGAGA
jgi:hypothetical protein